MRTLHPESDVANRHSKDWVLVPDLPLFLGPNRRRGLLTCLVWDMVYRPQLQLLLVSVFAIPTRPAQLPRCLSMVYLTPSVPVF